MKSSTKIILVVCGYLAAFVFACIVVSIYVAVTQGPDRLSSSGMYAFGDSMLFLAVFGLAAIPATAAALFFLRRYPVFWRVSSIGALGIALTGLAALVGYLVPTDASTGSFLGNWSMFSPLRILLAPLFAIAFFLAVLFTPTRSSRIMLISAAAIEVVVFGWVALLWFPSVRYGIHSKVTKDTKSVPRSAAPLQSLDRLGSFAPETKAYSAPLDHPRGFSIAHLLFAGR